MKKLYRRLYSREEGFTLVELMIVIIILAILTAIAVPSYMVLRNRARVAAAQSEMKNIATALEMFNADYDRYPAVTDVTAMAGALNGTNTAQNPDGNPYMDPVPVNDPWGQPYVYTSNGTTYTLSCSTGNTDNTDDIIIIDGQLQ
ncbi:MAG: type II secretion system protein GspG [Actinomycetota bacterium]|nr:type II secretion system protein GspG [Actinomycetota bacterium]MDD5600486.1 type II secretion system protein GspG [Actinomycetota bacterium]